MEGGTLQRRFPRAMPTLPLSLVGPLLNHIMKRGRLTERDASLIVRDIANGLNFLHSKGMSHRYVGRVKMRHSLALYSPLGTLNQRISWSNVPIRSYP